MHTLIHQRGKKSKEEEKTNYGDAHKYQKVMRGGEERVAQMKLIGGWEKQGPHVDRQQVSAMTASDSYGLEQTCAGNTHLKTREELIKMHHK